MGLFSPDIIEKDVHLPLKTQFALDLMGMIRERHRDLINTQKVRGYEGVLFLIHMYILSLKRLTTDPEKVFLKYGNLRIEQKIEPGITTYDQFGFSHWHPDPEKNGWVTHIKGEYYITIPTDGYNMVRQPDGSLTEANWEEYGEIIICLDKYLRIKYYKVLDYDHDWLSI